MLYKEFGKTGLEVSTISLGTVSFGVPYGIPVAGDFGPPAPTTAARVLTAAADSGINLFDTAPSYGNSEKLLGGVFSGRSDLYIATKVSVPKHQTAKQRQRAVRNSLEKSLRLLRREVLDIVQIHNARAEDIQRGEIVDLLLEARQDGLVRFLGASVYGEQAAAEAMKNNYLDVLQIAYSILDQRIQSNLSEAGKTGTAVLVRSALLKGVLSVKGRVLQGELGILRQAAERVCEGLKCTWEDLPEVALRFCLSSEDISSVLLGVRTLEELQQGLAAWEQGPLSQACLEAASTLALNEETWVNPSHWGIP
jgi:aryl-alcohol dehydrogenase-like predicted oxidoreductase